MNFARDVSNSNNGSVGVFCIETNLTQRRLCYGCTDSSRCPGLMTDWKELAFFGLTHCKHPYYKAEAPPTDLEQSWFLWASYRSRSSFFLDVLIPFKIKRRMSAWTRAAYGSMVTHLQLWHVTASPSLCCQGRVGKMPLKDPDLVLPLCLADRSPLRDVYIDCMCAQTVLLKTPEVWIDLWQSRIQKKASGIQPRDFPLHLPPRQWISASKRKMIWRKSCRQGRKVTS